MSPLWRIYLYPLLRSSAVWLALQPFMVAASFDPRFLEAQLVVLGALLAFGVQAALPRERAEYLRQLPFPRREVARSIHVAAMIVLAAACLFDYLADVYGLGTYAIEWLNHHNGRQSEPVWKPHLERAVWLGLYGLPFLSYWACVSLLQRRRTQSSKMLPRVSWLVLLGPVILIACAVGLGWAASEGSQAEVFWGNVTGALAACGAWWLARRALARAERLGCDAFPQEEPAWES